MVFLLFLTLGLGMLLTTKSISANVVELSEIELDTSVVQESGLYTLNDRILIAPIFMANNNLDVSAEEHFKGLHYYTISRLGYSDIPFHYVVTKNGTVFEANSGGLERSIPIVEYGTGAIVIAYLAPRGDDSFSSRAESALVELVAEVANQNAILPENLDIQQINFERDINSREVTMEAITAPDSWVSVRQEIVDEVEPLYNPIEKDYEIAVDEVILPTELVEPGESIELQITLSNLRNTGLYTGTTSEIILSKQEGGASAFFSPDNWISSSELRIMDSDDSLLPFGEAIFDATIRAPLFVGEIREEFVLRTIGGQTIADETISLVLNIAQTDRAIIEVGETETGTLNVRATPSSVGNEIGQVSPGQRFFVLEDAGNGWIRIDLGDGTSGWVAGWLVNVI